MSQDMFDLSLDDPVEFSGVSGSATPSSNSSPSLSSQGSQPQPRQVLFTCSHCKKVLKTSRGLIQHEQRHRLDDANASKPNAEKVRVAVLHIMDNVLQEMIAEASESENLILQELEKKKEDVEWVLFSHSLGRPMYEELCEKNKVLPLNQYEEVQKKLNTRLNDEQRLNSLVGQFKDSLDSDISDNIATRLVFRISMKLLSKMQVYIAQETLLGVAPSTTCIQEEGRMWSMSPSEERAFCESLGDLFRSQYSKASPNVPRQQMRECFKNKFVHSEQIITGTNFLNKSLWFSGNENAIVLSDNAINFFKIVEQMIEELKTQEKMPGAKDVLDKLLGSTEAMNVWFFLTNCYFVEDDSIVFLKSLVKAFVSHSLRMAESRMNRSEEQSIRSSQAALRVHLQRNYEKTSDLPS